MRPVSASKTVSSSIVIPMPMTVPPMIWLRASFSLKDAARVDGRHDPRDAHQSQVRVDANFREPRGEGAIGRRAAVRLRVPLAVRGHLRESVPGEDVDVRLTTRGGVDDVDAAVRGGDVVETRAPQRRRLVDGD